MDAVAQYNLQSDFFSRDPFPKCSPCTRRRLQQCIRIVPMYILYIRYYTPSDDERRLCNPENKCPTIPTPLPPPTRSQPRFA